MTGAETTKFETAQIAELSPRQRQILSLLQAGKVNKEIARELGISLGTVKQHVVALFKRLNVKNRTMAVSHGFGKMQETALIEGAEGQLERRPCVVMSLALPEDVDAKSARLMHSLLAAVAFDHDAILLSRHWRTGDLIFGVKQVSEHDTLNALQAVTQLRDEMKQALGSTFGLRGSLAAGVAIASMLRHGGWSGEAIASSTITGARDLLSKAPADVLVLNTEARDLFRAFGIGWGHQIPLILPLQQLEMLLWSGERISYNLVGRRAELSQIKRWLSSSDGNLMMVSGEAGMGKSRICQAIAGDYEADGLPVVFYRGLPGREDPAFLAVPQGERVLVKSWLSQVEDGTIQDQLLIIDDLHLFSEADAVKIILKAIKLSERGVKVCIAGRRHVEMPGIVRLHLGRLPTRQVTQIVKSVTNSVLPKDRCSSIVDLASGVPLFAVELARYSGGSIPLSLLVIVLSRLESLRIDRILLHRVAANEEGVRESHLIEEGFDVSAIEEAIACGVMTLNKNGLLVISHPLLNRVINDINVRNYERSD